MKNPRIEDFDPNAKAHQLKSSFEGMPAIEIPSRNEKARKPESPQVGLPSSPQTRLPESGQTSKTVYPQTHLPENRPVEKYTTRLEPSLIKQIKQFALEQDMKDYEVVRQAVKEYLAKNR